MMDEDLILELLSANKKIEDDFLLEILNEKDYRQIIINQYEYFSSNDKIKLSNYIDVNYNSKVSSNFKSELLDLSCKIGYLSKLVCDSVFIELKERRNYFFKLSALDYLNEFYFEIEDKRVFFELNHFLFRNSYNKLIIFEAAINLLIIDENYYKQVLLKKIRDNKTEPFYYYRLVNTLLNFKQFDFLVSFLNDILMIIKSSENLTLNQRNELIDRIRDRVDK